MKNKIIAILLTICLVVAICPVTVFAETTPSQSLIDEGFTLDYYTQDNPFYAQETDSHLEIYSKTTEKKQLFFKEYAVTLVFRVIRQGEVYAEYESKSTFLNKPNDITDVMKKDKKLGDVYKLYDALMTAEYEVLVLETVEKSDARNDPQGTAKQLEEQRQEVLAGFEGVVSDMQYEMNSQIATAVVDEAASVLVSSVEEVDPVIGFILGLIKEFCDWASGETAPEEEDFSSHIAQLMGKNVMKIVGDWTVCMYDSLQVVNPDKIYSGYKDTCSINRQLIIEKIIQLDQS